MIKGHASDDRETFEFTIEPFVNGGFRLDIRFSGDGRHNITRVESGQQWRRQNRLLRRLPSDYFTEQP